MNYHQRLILAIACSVVLHILAVIPGGCGHDADRVLALHKPPIVLNLQNEPEHIRHLIDPGVAANEPVVDTDLISDRNTKAQDMSDVIDVRPAPFFDETSDFDRLVPVPTPSTVPVVSPKPQMQDNAIEEEERQDNKQVEDHLSIAKANDVLLKQEELEDEITDVPIDDPENPEDLIDAPEGREGGGITGKGILSFEAKRHEMAPYMRKLQKMVERHWLATLEMKYNGVKATSAVIDCSISPEGRLVYARIVDHGDSFGYAPLCKEAIERSAPFPHFPFEVPEIYRTKNLEIRWTFHFL